MLLAAPDQNQFQNWDIQKPDEEIRVDPDGQRTGEREEEAHPMSGTNGARRNQRCARYRITGGGKLW